MKRVICLALILTILVSGLAFVKVEVRGLSVGGNITSNTEWTVSDSPVIINSSMRIYPNSTLIVDPGVTVVIGRYSIMVSGTLVAAGNPDNPITFTVPDNQTSASIYFDTASAGWSDATNSGSIFQYVNFNKIYISLSPPVKIDHCYFSFANLQSAIRVNSGSPIISNNKFVFTGQDPSHYAYGISVSMASPIITNNEFDGNGQLTGINAQSSTVSFTVSGNTFSDCWLGIKAETKVALTVEGNTFEHCNDGLDINIEATLTIKSNLIDGCLRYGINGGGYIDSNTITNNQIGIHNPNSGSTITNNNIVGNSENSITAAKGASVTAQNNWWGISDEKTILSTIYDSHIDSTLGTITFLPFLYSPSSSAPAIPASTPQVTPAPTINPTPNNPTTETPTASPAPTVSLTPAPTIKSETILNNSGDLFLGFFNLNLITTAVMAALALVWVVVILGYVGKKLVTKYRMKSKESER